MNSASEDLFEIVHAIVLFEGLKVLRRPDERHFAELPGALAAEARHLLAGADAAADRRLLRGCILLSCQLSFVTAQADNNAGGFEKARPRSAPDVGRASRPFVLYLSYYTAPPANASRDEAPEHFLPCRRRENSLLK